MLQVKVNTDTKHQEDDADFRGLSGYVGIGYETRSERTDNDARQQIPHDGRQVELLRNETQYQSESQRSRQSEYQIDVMIHPVSIIAISDRVSVFFLVIDHLKTYFFEPRRKSCLQQHHHPLRRRAKAHYENSSDQGVVSSSLTPGRISHPAPVQKSTFSGDR
jgi:hypothetical protein